MTLESQKHRDAILRAFNDVVNDKTSTDWALFGYEGQTNVLKVVGTGEDGLEEMAEDLNSSKIMYAVVRVTDPKTTRPKVVLINWQGEGAPMQRKGMCARHLNDVHKLLRGVHVTVNARTEEEVEPEVVMAAVQKASATTYNFSERSEVNDKTTPVPKPSSPSGHAVASSGDGSQSIPSSKKPKPKMKLHMGTNYKRTNPLAEIDSKSRNKFWEEQEAEERRRKTEEQQKKDEELRKLETERKQREINDAQQRDRLTKERNARILAERKAEEAAAQRCAAQNDLKWQQDLESQHQEEFERARRAEQMRLERKKEAESLIGQRMHSTRAMFESGISNSQQTADKNRPPPRKLKEFNPVNSQGSREEIHDRGTSAPSRGVAARWPPAAATETQPTTPSHTREMLNSSVVTSHSRTPVQASYSASSSPPAAPIKQPPETSQPHSVSVSSGYVRNLRDTLPAHSPSEVSPPAHSPSEVSPPAHSPSEVKGDHQQGQHGYRTDAVEEVHMEHQAQSPSPKHHPHVTSQPAHSTTDFDSTSTNNHKYTAPNVGPHHNVITITQTNNEEHQAFNQQQQQSQQQQQPQQHQQPEPQIYENQSSLYQNYTQQISVNQEMPQQHFMGHVTSEHTNGDLSHDYYDRSVVSNKVNNTIVTQEATTYETSIYSNIPNNDDVYETTVQSNSATTGASFNKASTGMGMVYEVDGVEYQILPEHGLCARALYDYQAADDSEITFDPAEIITNIDQIDEGWWQGVGPDGMFGLFPANYVELING